MRPASNVFAIADPDPNRLALLESEIERTEEFAHVSRPAPTWLLAEDPLPATAADSDTVRRLGVVFIEGRDRFEVAGAERWPERLAESLDSAPQHLSRWPGDFSFLRFRADGTAQAVRACAGIAPVYLHRTRSGGLALGTRLRYFPTLLGRAFDPDPLINVSWRATTAFIDGRTFIEDVSILPPGTVTELRVGGTPRSTRYWDPRPEPGATLLATPEHPRRLRCLLLEALDRDLDPGGRNLLTLSGGVDSSVVGALASGTLGRGLSSWSLVSPHEPARGRELHYIESLTSAVGIGPVTICERTETANRGWLENSPALPFQVTHPALCELTSHESRQEVRVLVGGEFADEICGEMGRLTDWARATSPIVLALGLHALPFGRRDILRWGKRRLLWAVGRPPVPSPEALPPWAHPRLQAEYREWRHRRMAAYTNDSRPLGELAEHVLANGWVAMNWEALTSVGVRRALPFYNREVLELGFECNPRELLGPGSKKLLRDAVRFDVPAENLDRADKGAWMQPFRTRPQEFPPPEELPRAATRLIRPDWLARSPREATAMELRGLLATLRVARFLEGTP